MAAIARTAPFAVLTFGCHDTPDSGAPIFAGYWLPVDDETGEVRPGGSVQVMSGIREVAYFGDDAPPGYPSGSRVSDGCVDITFADNYTDDFGIVAPFSITQVKPGNAIADTLAYVAVEILSSHTIRVRVFGEDKVTPLPNGRVTGLAVY